MPYLLKVIERFLYSQIARAVRTLDLRDALADPVGLAVTKEARYQELPYDPAGTVDMR
jgi:hypothetical protein